MAFSDRSQWFEFALVGYRNGIRPVEKNSFVPNLCLEPAQTWITLKKFIKQQLNVVCVFS